MKLSPPSLPPRLGLSSFKHSKMPGLNSVISNILGGKVLQTFEKKNVSRDNRYKEKTFKETSHLLINKLYTHIKIFVINNLLGLHPTTFIRLYHVVFIKVIFDRILSQRIYLIVALPSMMKPTKLLIN